VVDYYAGYISIMSTNGPIINGGSFVSKHPWQAQPRPQIHSAEIRCTSRNCIQLITNAAKLSLEISL